MSKGKKRSTFVAKRIEDIQFQPTDHLHINYKGKRGKSEQMVFDCVITNSDGPTLVASTAALEHFWTLFPEAKEVSFNHYLVSATDISVMILLQWPENQRTMTAEAQMFVQYILTVIRQGENAVIVNSIWQDPERRDVHEIPKIALKGSELMRHQVFAYMAMSGSDGFGVFMEQGTGKTPTMIAHWERISRSVKDRMMRVIIVAPKNVRSNWADEVERFQTVPTQTTILRGGKMKRFQTCLQGLVKRDEGNKIAVIIVAYESWWKTAEVLTKVQWDVAILDEAHYIKWPRSQRAKFAFEFRDACLRRYALTGTPVCNATFDLFALLEWIREGGSGFSTFEHFRSYYGMFGEKTTDGKKRITEVQNLPHLKERLARMSIIVRKADAIKNMPPKTYSTIEVEMTKEMWDAYITVRDKLYAEIMDAMTQQSKVMTVQNVLTKLLRLAQVTSGFLSFDAIHDEFGIEVQPKTVDRFDPNPKLEALVESLNESLDLDEKAIVWACWVPDLKTIHARLEMEGFNPVLYYGEVNDKNREEAVTRFNNDPKCRVFIGNPAAGGTGLTLLGHDRTCPEKYDTDVTQMYYFSQGWSHPYRSQSEDRPHRIGTRRPVHIYDIVCAGTIDVEIRNRVTNKRLVAAEIGDLRNILETIMKGGPCDDEE